MESIAHLRLKYTPFAEIREVKLTGETVEKDEIEC